MNNIEYLDYIPLEKDKTPPVIIIRWNGIVLRFKILTNSKTGNKYPATASLLLKDPITQAEEFKPAFKIDSSYDEEKVNKFVMAEYRKHSGDHAINTPPANSNYPPIDQNRMGGMVMQETQQTMPF